MVGPKKRLYSGVVVNYFFASGEIVLVIFAYFIRDWRTLSWAILIPISAILIPYYLLVLIYINLFYYLNKIIIKLKTKKKYFARITSLVNFKR
jgi:hypothetical protein